ncbi:MAG: hypothetical protein ACK4TO_08575 [Candidatus Nitrosotenuis sp.]
MTQYQKIWLIAFCAIAIFAAAVPSVPVAFAQDVGYMYDDKTCEDKSGGKSCPGKNKGMTKILQTAFFQNSKIHKNIHGSVASAGVKR